MFCAEHETKSDQIINTTKVFIFLKFLLGGQISLICFAEVCTRFFFYIVYSGLVCFYCSDFQTDRILQALGLLKFEGIDLNLVNCALMDIS